MLVWCMFWWTFCWIFVIVFKSNAHWLIWDGEARRSGCLPLFLVENWCMYCGVVRLYCKSFIIRVVTQIQSIGCDCHANSQRTYADSKFLFLDMLLRILFLIWVEGLRLNCSVIAHIKLVKKMWAKSNENLKEIIWSVPHSSVVKRIFCQIPLVLQ